MKLTLRDKHIITIQTSYGTGKTYSAISLLNKELLKEKDKTNGQKK